MFSLLIRNHQLQLPAPSPDARSTQVLATVMSNLSHYGYGLTRQGYEQLSACSDDALRSWWPPVETALRALSGDDKDMGAHVVYKNFPAEVLAMSEAQYWLRQILMYWGLPNELVTQDEVARAPIEDTERSLRILRPAGPESLRVLRDGLLAQPARWTTQQLADLFLLLESEQAPVELGDVPFKENLVQVAMWLLAQGRPASVGTATDALRLAVGLSDGDVTLRERCKLRSFSRAERRFLLGLLEACRNLSADLARRPERFKRLLRALRPGDYASRYPRVVAAYALLYSDGFEPSWASRVEAAMKTTDPAALELLIERPGEFLRRLHAALLRLGDPAARTFEGVLPRLSVIQLLKIRRYLATVNARQWRTIAPRGNWAKLQVLDNGPERRLYPSALVPLDLAIGAELRRRLSEVVPGAAVDPRLRGVTLPSNDGDLTPYGRGTVFHLPDSVRFVRTASYWSMGSKPRGNIWFDNGWNFFDASWKSMGACCWNSVKFRRGAAVFSGDPTNSKDLKGRACQLVDLYPDKLAEAGVRYAVWNVLCYSRKTFDEAEEVFGSLQWGDDPQKGKLFEPSRCQLAFPIKGANYTRYVAYLDVQERTIVYMDANLKAEVQSAKTNGKLLSEVMPAYVEYLGTLPTVGDLLQELPKGEDLVAMYSDEGQDLTGRSAYVFRPSSDKGDFEAFDLSKLLMAM